MISESKLIEVINYFEENGFNATLLKFQLKPSSLIRYITLAKSIDRRIPKILLLDIEVSPIMAVTFDMFKPIFSEQKIIKDWNIICWSAKWLFQPEIMKACLTPEEAKAGNDKRIAKIIHGVINEADIIITYNGDRFDIRRLNTRFLIHNLPPTKEFKSLDLYKTIKNRFAFSRSKLDYVSQLIINKKKIETDIELWKDCLMGKQQALELMSQYCDNDVKLLEEVYLTIRGWIKSHPNVAIMKEAIDLCCPNCGSYDIEEAGEYFTPAGEYISYRCKSCGKYTRGNKNIIPKLTKKNLLR